MENKYQNNQDGKPNNKFNSYWIYGLLALLLLALNFYTLQSSSTKPLEWNTFKKMVQEKDNATEKEQNIRIKPPAGQTEQR